VVCWRVYRALMGRPGYLFACPWRHPRIAAILIVLVALCGATIFSEPAAAAPDFTWAGGAALGSPEWSHASNWTGGSGPSGTVGTVTFPALPRVACTASPPTETCYQSHNDVAGITANRLAIESGYAIDGNAVTIGADGVAVTNVRSVAQASSLDLPVTLGTSQSWSIDGGSGGYAELDLGGVLSGTASSLEVGLQNYALLDLRADDEVGPVTITGADPTNNGGGASANGFVTLGSDSSAGALNSSDHNPVTLSDVALRGSGSLGPLTTAGDTIQIGASYPAPPGTVAVNGDASLDAATIAAFRIDPSGSSRLTATGNVDLGGARLRAAVGAPACLASGQTFTIVSAAAVTGMFAGVPDGATVHIDPPVLDCTPAALRIHYTSSTVTGTVVTPPYLPGSAPPPGIGGTATQGQTLTETHGGWANDPTNYGYQWEDCDVNGNACQPIPGANSQSYLLAASDVGHTIVVQETAASAAGSGDPASSAPTGTVRSSPSGSTPTTVPPPSVMPAQVPVSLSRPAIFGPAMVGRRLSSTDGTWAGTAPVSYRRQWQRCRQRCADIVGATGATYTPRTGDLADRLRVLVSATNAAGTGTAVSSELGPTYLGPNAMKRALRLVVVGSRQAANSLMKSGTYPKRIKAPGAGRLTISWYLASTRGHPPQTRRTVATGAIRLRGASAATIRIKLTAAGKKALKHRTRVTLTGVASFTPTGQAKIVASETFTLRLSTRHKH
jgi:hypothetical protein